ncbi:MAG: sulfotransferase [Polaribacter sp.]|nr:sulfotransferase [Polaribacter sp.]
MNITTKPNLFIVGAAKAGTSSVFNYLNTHPDVFMSPIKEPNFFGSDIKWENFREDHKRNTKLDFDKYFSKQILSKIHIAFVKNKKYYMSLFRNSETFKIRGEGSTSYLYSTLAAKEIYEFNPNAKIIIILREPVDRTVSHYLMDYSRKNKKKINILEDLKSDFTTLDKGYCISNLYIDLSLYSEQILRYIDVFPKEQLILMNYDDLKNNPTRFMFAIFKFINVKELKINVKQSFNVTQQPKNRIVKMAALLEGILPVRLKNILLTKKELFYKPVYKDIVTQDSLDYIKNNVEEDWEKVKHIVEHIKPFTK